MSYNEQYQPTGSERFGFVEPSFFADLASAEFEIATLFYFNEHDGFTVSDAFALVVIFIGIFFFIKAFVAQDKKE